MIKYRWATLGCGVIANQLAQALQAQGSNLYSVANRTHDKAVAFAEKYGIEKHIPFIIHRKFGLIHTELNDLFAFHFMQSSRRED